MKRLIIGLLAVATIGAACGNTTSSDPNDPEHLPAYVENVDLIFLESYPVQVRAVVSGTVPTPCHEAAWEYDAVSSVAPAILVYSTTDPEAVCAQVLSPFEITIDVGSFETGDHVVVVNGETFPFTV